LLPASALVTVAGTPLRVLHPGRPGRGPGPDFRDAIIAPANGPLLRGDVELHLRASDFQTHGHANDRRYDRVILHVVFNGEGQSVTRLASGSEVPIVALASWLDQRTDQLASWLAGPRLWREPCHDALARLGKERLIELLDALGEERLREREQQVSGLIVSQGPGEACYRALLDVLGYGGDRARMMGLAGRVPLAALLTRLSAVPVAKRQEAAEALLLDAVGLLEPVSPPVPRRPSNHPARRLAGLAALIVRHRAGQGGLDVALAQTTRELVAGWTVAAHGRWREHTAPGVPGRGTQGALIGRARAIELLANAVLPWAAARADAEGDAAAAGRARQLLRALPRPATYGALAFLEENLRSADGPLPLDFRRQQGLLALYKTECTQGGCGRCALS
jgi:hypothetical protein